MPLWFKVAFWAQLTLNIVFIILALWSLAKIDEYWKIDSRNLWVAVRTLDNRFNDQHGAPPPDGGKE